MVNPDLSDSSDVDPLHREAVDLCRAALQIADSARELLESIANTLPGTRSDARRAAVRRVVASLAHEAMGPSATVEADLRGLLYADLPI